MPTNLLNLSATTIAASVEAVLAGATIENTAADLGVHPADLADALDAYRTAGLDALQHRQKQGWFHAHIAFPDWTTAEATFAAQAAPRLDALDDGRTPWWFLRKHPHWRLRVRTTNHSAAETVLDELATTGVIDSWRSGIYEPEAAAFGGAQAVDTVHDLFCADSRGVLAYARQHTPQLGRRELSILLIRALQQHAGLDWFEAGDVFDRITQLRPTPADTDAARIDDLATRMQPLLTFPADVDSPLFAAGPVVFAGPWLTGFIQAGKRLRDAAATGQIDRGLRAIIAQIVIFHWNRLGLSAAAQSILAHAAKAAILPRS